MVHEQTTVVRMADEHPVSETVVFAVAAARGVCPIELEAPLHDAINADALDRLLSGADHRPTNGPLRVEFTWAGCDVVVQGTGRVVAKKSAADIDEAPVLTQ